MKTTNLIGPALDWAVAKCEGHVTSIERMFPRSKQYKIRCGAELHYEPSTDWAQGGPIIERERIEFSDNGEPGSPWSWSCFIDKTKSTGQGRTHLIAAMRCYVSSKLGEEIEIPDDLCST